MRWGRGEGAVNEWLSGSDECSGDVGSGGCAGQLGNRAAARRARWRVSAGVARRRRQEGVQGVNDRTGSDQRIATFHATPKKMIELECGRHRTTWCLRRVPEESKRRGQMVRGSWCALNRRLCTDRRSRPQGSETALRWASRIRAAPAQRPDRQQRARGQAA